MSHILIYIAESIVCSGLFLLLYHMLITKKANYRFCRRYLITTLIISYIIPAVNIPVYIHNTDSQFVSDFIVWNNDKAPTQNLVQPTVGKEQTEDIITGGTDIHNSQIEINWTSIMIYVYITGVLISISLLVISLFQIHRLRNKSHVVKYGLYYIAENPDVSSPFSFLRTIFLANDYEEHERTHLLKHEISHIKHRHSQEKILISLIRSFLWFNPFAWMSEKKLEEVQEWQADQDALSNSTELEEYQNTIIKLLFGLNPSASLGLNNSFTKNRLLHMRMREQKNHGKSVNIATLCLALLCICLFSVKPIANGYAAGNGSISVSNQKLDSSAREQLKILYLIEEYNRLIIYADKVPDNCTSDNVSFFHYSFEEKIWLRRPDERGGIEIYKNLNDMNKRCVIAVNGYKFAESTKSRKLYWVNENTWIYIDNKLASLQEFRSIDESGCIGIAYYRARKKSGPSLVYVVTTKDSKPFNNFQMYNYDGAIDYPGADLPEFENCCGERVLEESFIVQSYDRNVAEPEINFAVNGRLTDFENFLSSTSSVFILRGKTAEQRYGAGIRAVAETRSSRYSISLRFQMIKNEAVPFVNGKQISLEKIPEYIAKYKRNCEKLNIDLYMHIVYNHFVPAEIIETVNTKYIPDDPNVLVAVNYCY